MAAVHSLPMAGEIHAVLGTDEATVAEKALKLFEKIKPQGGDDFANDVIDGTAANSDEAYEICKSVIQALQTLPFFGGVKVVWLKNANFLAEDRTGKAEMTQQGVEALLEVLKAGLPDDVTFLISASQVSKVRRFYKHLASAANLQVHDKIDTSKQGWEDQVRRLVEKQAAKLELAFQPDALELFVMQVGEDTRQIKSELEKLDLHLGTRQREVDVQTVRLMVPLSREGVIFEIGRAIEAGDGLRAMDLIDQRMELDDKSAISIMRAAIIPTMRNLFIAKVVMSEGSGSTFATCLASLPKHFQDSLPRTKAGKVNTWGLQNASKQVGKFSLPQLKKAMQSCLKADEALVTTGLDHHMILHRLITELVTINAAKA